MSSISRLILPLAALALCLPPHTASAASSPASGTQPGPASGTRAVPIEDPTLNNLAAVEVTIPAKWHFQGVLYQGGNCTPTPAAVYRSTSPDGLSRAERMPTLSWFYGSGPFLQYMPHTDCLPLNAPLSAQQFLHYMAATMHLQYLGDDPVPADVNAKAHKDLQDAQAEIAPKYAAAGLTPPKSTRELARALVAYKNGTFAMKGRLSVTIDCMETLHPGQQTLGPYAGPGHPPQLVRGAASTVDKCTAAIDYVTAPEAQFTAILRQWDAPGMGQRMQDPWKQAWIQRNNAQTQQNIADIQRQGAIARKNSADQFAQSQAQRDASNQQFAHDQSVRQNMHEQFLATMQRGTDMSMARTRDNMNARSTATSDWVDYALDRQTVRDPTTGQLTKVDSGYNATWIDSTGKVSYQTNDVNANPNGVFPGTWNQQNVTHGNGAPR